MTSIVHLAIPGGWSDREVAVGPHRFRLLTPANPDQLLDHLEEPSDTSRPHLADPFWAKLWPAATPLAEAIVRNPPATSCLELGCGSGLVGLAALAAGLAVTLSDYVPKAVELALENAARNGFPQARGLVLDWRQPIAEQFPLIVAADVTYDRENLGPLLGVLDAMLTPSGQAWFGDAGRSPTVEFVSQATARGWEISLFDEHDHRAEGLTLASYRRIVLRRPD